MIKRAIISVSDKTGIAEFSRKLVEMGVEILSTGGTAKILSSEGIPCKEVAEITGFPECLDGRVKTLHPRIHGGILAIRSNPEHMKRIEELGIETIDLVKKVFEHTAAYDALIAQYFLSRTPDKTLPDMYTLTFDKVSDLRYGENPHQK